MNDIWESTRISIEDYAPRVFAALLILLVGWLIATVVASATRGLLHRVRLDQRLATSLGEGSTVSTTAAIARAVFWIIMLLVVIVALEALALEAATAPLSEVMSSIIGFLPNLIAAALILLIGFVVARLLRSVATNLAAAVGTDRIGARAGLPQGDVPRLSEVIGLIVFTMVLVPTIVAALHALEIDAVTQPTSNMLNTILNAFPAIVSAALLLLIAYLVARIVTQLVVTILAGLGFNNLPAQLGIDNARARVAGQEPAQIVGGLLFALIMLLAVMEAAELVGFVTLSALVASFLVYLGQIVVGLVIIAIGFWLAGLIGNAVRASGVTRADLVATIARVAVVVLAIAIGLGEMGIADGIVLLAFGLPLAAVALGLAIGIGVAVGIGGRDVAGRELESLRQTLRGGSGPGPVL